MKTYAAIITTVTVSFIIVYGFIVVTLSALLTTIA